MGMREVLNVASTALDQTNFNNKPLASQSNEMSRILRTCSSSQAIRQTNFPGCSQLSPSKISMPFDVEVTDRVEQVVQATGTLPNKSKNNIDETVAFLDKNNEMLTDPTIPLSDEVNSLFPADEPEIDKRNFLIQVNQLVAEIMQLLSKLSDRDRNRTDHMKKDFNMLNNLAGDSIRSRGAWGLSGSLFGLGATIACSFIAPGLSQAVGGVAQSFGNLYATQEEANTATFSNKISLINTELQNIATKGSDNSGWKNELIQSLNDVKEWMRASARTNG